MTQIEVAIVIVNGVVAFLAFWMFDRLSARMEVQIRRLREDIDGLERMVVRHKHSLDAYQERSHEQHQQLLDYFDLELHTPPPANTKPRLRIKPDPTQKEHP